MSFGTDWSWLNTLLGTSNPVGTTTQVLPQGASNPPAPSVPPPGGVPMGLMPISPEMGGGANRQVGLNTVDALGYFNNNVNTASAVAAGREPTTGDRLKDLFGIDGPHEKRNLSLLMAAGMLAPAALMKGGKAGPTQAAPALPPLQQPAASPVRLPAKPQLPVYPWSMRRPPGLLYDGGA